MSVDVSIIIPVYNMEKYLEECLESVFNQTYSNIELIIVNDGSTDKSKYIIEKYIEKYKNIIFIDQKNQGLSTARNNALKLATGKYVLFLDSDDFLDKECIELIYNKAIKTNSDVVIMGYTMVYSTKQNIEVDYKKYVNSNEFYSGSFIANLMLEDIIEGYSCNKLIKIKNLRKNNLKFEPDKYIEDLYPIFKHIYNCDKITFVNKCLYNYRQREDSLSHSTNIKLINDYSHARKEVLSYVKDKKDLNRDSIFIFNYNSFRTIISLLNKLNNKSNNIYRTFYTRGYKIHEPSIKDIYQCKKIKLTARIDIIMWEFRIYHILMPGLLNFKKYIECLINNPDEKIKFSWRKDGI
ncbi:MAG: glycosyltransferase family 2 protein [Romboutsia sp.]